MRYSENLKLFAVAINIFQKIESRTVITASLGFLKFIYFFKYTFITCLKFNTEIKTKQTQHIVVIPITTVILKLNTKQSSFWQYRKYISLFIYKHTYVHKDIHI